ncbi:MULTISPECIES: DUF4845 domain-containing protein [unclassified Oleiphilus]|jgi:hypothetical protein|nr:MULTISPECIES: DUF4845 domain-containing protein [unclassified Oleiphilus]KZY45095.1 hypothetical protein A3732_11165 [Oleiphilus sp. HI0050]KZY74166.1 hypothetical protein A3740_17325 [Oleiphilus sp. HI0068]KZY86309.1 hypothetical protein A3741_02215 [Oleiphilus sp. HI0069]KZY86356.1 hypothetical protein A3743_02480 [Oleiphilus sp. HI0072]KZZ21405.1 hypothetical protein A3752_09105 [Oleiphilus sp. HI0081]KZZ33865.1 hypothetical protein A3755_06955 [Oleiphilus sp. HI0085]KZZ71407.1 hypothe
MRTDSRQKGASMPVVLLFLGMAAIILTIAFKLYPAFYEHWQIASVLESYDKEVDLEGMSAGELETNFQTRLLTNNVRTFDVKEGFYAEVTDESVYISVEYEVRIPIYSNIDAVVSFEESIEKKF